MIRFFRKIRQGLLAQNRFTQYLIYALGEIILVVIGILIALSINNWNQERINTAKSHELLSGMVKDLALDISRLDRAITHYKSRLAFFERHFNATDFSTTPTDTLFSLFDGATVPFTVTDLSYEKAKNLGISQLCSNDSLALRINTYYTESLELNKLLVQYEFDELTKQNDFWMKDQEGLEFNFNTSFRIPVLQDSIARRDNAIALITSPQGRNYLKEEVYMKDNMIKIQQGNRARAQELRTDIKDYLTE
jgi:hypothetical protein